MGSWPLHVQTRGKQALDQSSLDNFIFAGYGAEKSGHQRHPLSGERPALYNIKILLRSARITIDRNEHWFHFQPWGVYCWAVCWPPPCFSPSPLCTTGHITPHNLTHWPTFHCRRKIRKLKMLQSSSFSPESSASLTADLDTPKPKSYREHSRSRSGSKKWVRHHS